MGILIDFLLEGIGIVLIGALTIFIINLLFIKENGKCKLKFIKNNFQGKVIPNSIIIKNQIQLDKYKKIYKKASLAEPLLIYLYTILIAVVFIILFTSNSSQVVFVLKIHLAVLIFLNFMDIKSNVKDNVGLTDFKLIKNLNENDCFICFLFYENIYLGTDFHRKIRENCKCFSGVYNRLLKDNNLKVNIDLDIRDLF
jgi:hypothetical protein